MGKRKRTTAALLAATAAAVVPHASLAADLPLDQQVVLRGRQPEEAEAFLPRFFVHVGPGSIMLSEGAKVKMNGAIVPGASVKVDSQITAAFEAGYFFTPNIAVSLTGGFPPTIDIMGKGSIAAVGRLGKMTYGPAVMTAHYHFRNFGAFQPYVGAGPTFLINFGTKDGALANLRVANSIGFAGQIGFDYMFDQRWGMFVDVKKAFLRTTATGLLGGAPTKSAVKLDPLVVHTGVTYRF